MHHENANESRVGTIVYGVQLPITQAPSHVSISKEKRHIAHSPKTDFITSGLISPDDAPFVDIPFKDAEYLNVLFFATILPSTILILKATPNCPLNSWSGIDVSKCTLAMNTNCLDAQKLMHPAGILV